MAGARKLATEIDRTLKTVSEHVEIFNDYYERVSTASSPPSLPLLYHHFWFWMDVVKDARTVCLRLVGCRKQRCCVELGGHGAQLLAVTLLFRLGKEGIIGNIVLGTELPTPSHVDLVLNDVGCAMRCALVQGSTIARTPFLCTGAVRLRTGRKS